MGAGVFVDRIKEFSRRDGLLLDWVMGNLEEGLSGENVVRGGGIETPEGHSGGLGRGSRGGHWRGPWRTEALPQPQLLASALSWGADYRLWGGVEGTGCSAWVRGDGPVGRAGLWGGVRHQEAQASPVCSSGYQKDLENEREGGRGERDKDGSQPRKSHLLW